MRRLTIMVLCALLLSVLPWSAQAEEKLKCVEVEDVLQADGTYTTVCASYEAPPGDTSGTIPTVPGQPIVPVIPVPIPGCAAPVADPTACLPRNAAGGIVNVPAAARTAALSLTIPEPTVIIGPDPARNKWNMIPIGFPLWIWTTEPKTMHASTTEQGITITMTATQGPTTVTFGDGTTITCQTMTPRAPVILPPPPSPDCGHTYRDKGHYVISATTTWTITWDALGFTGTIPMPRTGTAPLHVGELTAVLVEGP